jgi:hypothetical protein
VTGRRFERSVDFEHTGEPFDVGRVSDYDVAIASDTLVARAGDADMTLPTDRALLPKELSRLGLRDLAEAAQAASKRHTGIAHPVRFKLFPNGGVPAKGPELPLQL